MSGFFECIRILCPGFVSLELALFFFFLLSALEVYVYHGVVCIVYFLSFIDFFCFLLFTMSLSCVVCVYKITWCTTLSLTYANPSSELRPFSLFPSLLRGLFLGCVQAFRASPLAPCGINEPGETNLYNKPPLYLKPLFLPPSAPLPAAEIQGSVRSAGFSPSLFLAQAGGAKTSRSPPAGLKKERKLNLPRHMNNLTFPLPSPFFRDCPLFIFFSSLKSFARPCPDGGSK